MSDKNNNYVQQLSNAGLSHDEALIYIELLKERSTHLHLSRNTGIARTKVYRLIDQLEKRGLIQRHVDDQGASLVAADPANLEIELTQQEESIKHRRRALDSLIPHLTELRHAASSSFQIRTYEGERGFRQMCWHELKTQGELLALGGGTIEELIPNHRWAERHRELSVRAGYKVREIINKEVDMPVFTSNLPYLQNQYSCRTIPKSVIAFDSQTIVYNDTVAIFDHRHIRKIGLEIVSPTYANMMRTIFENYWAQSTDSPDYT